MSPLLMCEKVSTTLPVMSMFCSRESSRSTACGCAQICGVRQTPHSQPSLAAAEMGVFERGEAALGRVSGRARVGAGAGRGGGG